MVVHLVQQLAVQQHVFFAQRFFIIAFIAFIALIALIALITAFIGFASEIVATALEQLVRNVALVSEGVQPFDFGLHECGNFIVRQPRSPRLLVRLAVVVSVHIRKRHDVLD